jgi:hypothetical protein
MITLPFDIIYEIYFYLDDYITACNFWLLCKPFTKNYMKYISYKHKFNILFNNLFTFLVLLPENTNNNENNNGDLDFYEMISTQFLNNYDKSLITNDIRFVYNLYKTFFVYYLIGNLTDDISPRLFNLSTNLSSLIMLQGPDFINNFTIVNFKKNNVKILPKYNSKSNALRNFMKYYNRYNFDWVNNQIEYLQGYI